MDDSTSTLSGDKNPFAELTSLGDSGSNSQKKKSLRPSLLSMAFVLRIIATVVVGGAVIFAADAFIRASDTRPAFIPAGLYGYLTLGVEGESNAGGLTLQELSAQYTSESQGLLDLYSNSAADVTYQRSLVEFFEKNPEVEFIKSQNEAKYNILTLADEFARMTRSRDEHPYITYDCRLDTLSDAGMLKASCDIYSSANPFVTGTKSVRVAAAELLESFGSKESKFILKSTPKSLAIQETSERAFTSKTSISLELQALPSLLP